MAKGEKAIAQLSSKFGVHANQIRQWRKQRFKDLPNLFSDRQKKKEREGEVLQAELYRQIGQLKVELDWLKKISIALLRINDQFLFQPRRTDYLKKEA